MSSTSSNNESNGNPPRLFITKMVLENFKSYGGVREVGPFHKRFSSIVGPNGSGKSNVIDAMLFVFGKKAKKLRLNKVSELIHKSDGFQNLEHCRVSVHFVDIIDNPDHEDNFEEVPGTGLVVTRIAYKNNSSKYLLDNKASTFTEVGALLRKRGIDLDNNRFLILQGEVEQIAMMPPKAKTEHDEGLLEFLEDIIGSNRHLDAINEEEKKLDLLNEERGEKLSRLKVTETERDNLEGAKTEAESAVRKAREVRMKQNILYQRYCSDANNNVKKISEQQNELKTRREYEQNKLKEKEVELLAEEEAANEIIAEHEALRKECDETKLKFTTFERQDIKMREDVKHNKSSLKKLTATIKAEELKANQQSNKGDELEASLPELNKTVDTCNAKQVKEEEKLETLLEAAKHETEKLRSGLEAKQEAIAPVKQQVSEVEAQIGTIETEINLVKNSATNAMLEMKKLDKELNRIESEHESKLQEVEKAKQEMNDLNGGDNDGENIDAMVLKEAELVKNMTLSVAKAEEAKTLLSSQNSQQSGVVGALMKACKNGKPLHKAGLLGRLGDLASIDAKYDVAISTACGYLDYMVVETQEGGSKAIDFLRKNNIGRVSFIVLDQIRAKAEKQMNSKFDVPSGAERLFDLTHCSDPSLKCALYFALKNTLVCKNLDEASSIAYVGSRPVHRVVTLKGELIETSGTMSGGGNRVKKGSMKISSSAAAASSSSSSSSMLSDEEVTKEMVSELEKQAEMASQELASFRQKLSNMRLKKAANVETLRKLKIRIPKLEMSIDNVTAMLPEIQERKTKLLPKCELTKEEENKVKELEAEVKKARQDAAGITKEFKALQKGIDELQASIMAAGGEPVKVQRKKVAQTKAALDDAESKVASVQVDIKGARKASEKASKAVEKAKTEHSTLEEKQAKLQEELAELEVSAEEVMAAYNNAVKQADEKEKALKKANTNLEASRNCVAKIKAVEVDITIQLDEYAVKIKENKGHVSNWGKQLEKLNQEHATCLKDWGELKEDNTEEAAEEEDMNKSTDEQSSDNKPEPVVAAAEEENNEEEDEDDEDVLESGSRTKRSRKTKAKDTQRSSSVTCLQVFTDEQLANYDKEPLKYEISLLEEKRDELFNAVNMSAIAEYRKKAKDYDMRFKELEEQTERRDACRVIYEDYRRTRLEEFLSGFGEITLRLKEMYQMITLGGDAELELVDSLDPFSEGIVFSVRPPKKSWKNIANLSGGEKTLSSLALVFALHHYKPTPLYVMDEIDAALDFKNVSIVANYIKERTKNAQFVIISLRNNMFELADRLVGIYKTNDTTKSVTINPKLFSAPEVERLSRQVERADSNPLRNLTNIAAAATTN
mmetsp:Transcript_1063/g.1326  ORF Transcript_1063/g.1326 Transcript_1063/m.1326 type:complete len:1353 (+) Transcript_1063:32-4090(+)